MDAYATNNNWLTSLADPRLDDLLAVLRGGWEALNEPAAWPGEQLQALGDFGVYAWFLPTTAGGLGWPEVDLLRGLVKLGSACLTTAFILTQRVAAATRIAACPNESLQRALLPRLLTAETFATIGISHLTTSRRHVAAPVLRAEERDGAFILNGYTPWVTGATHAETIVIGATLPDERQLLAAINARTPGVAAAKPERLVALSASHTGRVEFHNAILPAERLLVEPKEHVLQQGLTIRTGGSQTSALAIGVADRALEILEHEAAQRDDLAEPVAALRAEWNELLGDMLALAEHKPVCTTEDLRRRANSLVLRASEAALAASKGAGYAASHPAGRLCREALFFLVWSCPQPVTNAHLCELAGLG
jgi:alkylation response protein AidB-like acyl-CoA dehydrogenase